MGHWTISTFVTKLCSCVILQENLDFALQVGSRLINNSSLNYIQFGLLLPASFPLCKLEATV